MDSAIALSVNDIASRVVDVLWFSYSVGIQLIACLALGYLTAKKTGRSVFNWLCLGFVNAVIPVVGFLLMLAAYYWYPPPTPRPGPGYHPRKDGGGQRRR